jgi:hypothetical protein
MMPKKVLKELKVEDNKFFILTKRFVKKKKETKNIRLYRRDADAVSKIKEHLKDGVKVEDIELLLVYTGAEMTVETIPWKVIAVRLIEPTPQPVFSQIEKELEEEVAPKILSAERGAMQRRVNQDLKVIKSFLNL